MGTYWNVCNFTRRERIEPLHDSVKVWESLSPEVAQALGILLASGRWMPSDNMSLVSDMGEARQVTIADGVPTLGERHEALDLHDAAWEREEDDWVKLAVYGESVQEYDEPPDSGPGIDATIGRNNGGSMTEVTNSEATRKTYWTGNVALMRTADGEWQHLECLASGGTRIVSLDAAWSEFLVELKNAGGSIGNIEETPPGLFRVKTFVPGKDARPSIMSRTVGKSEAELRSNVIRWFKCCMELYRGEAVEQPKPTSPQPPR